MMLKVNSIQLFFKTYFLKALLVGFIVTFLSSCTEVKKREPATYLIPEGYVGALYIVFNAPNGQPPKYEGHSRVYHIPPSGVLVTQMDANEGWSESSEIKYFSVSQSGKRVPISAVSEDTPDNTRALYSGGLGEAGPIFGCTVINKNFTIGTKSERTDLNKLLSIFEAIKVKNIDKKLFKGMC